MFLPAYLHSQYHILYHLIPLRNCVPCHLGPLGDCAVIRLIGVNFHILPDLPLLFGKFLWWSDPAQPVQDCLSLGVQLLDEHFQLLLTLFTGMGVDTFGVLRAVRPGGRVAALEEGVVDLSNAAGPRLSGAPHDRLEVSERIFLKESNLLTNTSLLRSVIKRDDKTASINSFISGMSKACPS